jgi:hypothetical protein
MRKSLVFLLKLHLGGSPAIQMQRTDESCW